MNRFEKKLNRLEPWLKKTRWFPMTHMAVPSLLLQLDNLIEEMSAYRGNDHTVFSLLNRAIRLRKNFRFSTDDKNCPPPK